MNPLDRNKDGLTNADDLKAAGRQVEDTLKSHSTSYWNIAIVVVCALAAGAYMGATFFR